MALDVDFDRLNKVLPIDCAESIFKPDLVPVLRERCTRVREVESIEVIRLVNP